MYGTCSSPNALGLPGSATSHNHSRFASLAPQSVIGKEGKLAKYAKYLYVR
jgi:hypothetical protein